MFFSDGVPEFFFSFLGCLRIFSGPLCLKIISGLYILLDYDVIIIIILRYG